MRCAPATVALIVGLFHVVALAAPFQGDLDLASYAEHYVLFIEKNNSATSVRTSSAELKVVMAGAEGLNALVLSTADRTASVQGWEYVRFTAVPWLLQHNMVDAYYAAGYLEGFVTHEAILNAFLAAPIKGRYVQQCVDAWIKEHVAFLRSAAAGHEPSFQDQRYVQQLAALLAQVDGLHHGYKVSPSARQRRAMSWEEIFYLNFDLEMDHLATICRTPPSANAPQHQRRLPEHCSALIKISAHYANVIVGHNTWSTYDSMIRQHKTYVFQTTVSMTGYPGTITSGDDWLVTSRGLHITETTIECSDRVLRNVTSARSVSAFIRTMVASYLADSPAEWVALIGMWNSGTYNNQFIVLDVANISTATKARQPLPPQSIYIVETVPGLSVHADVTEIVKHKTYWASYNWPYFADVRKLCSPFSDEGSIVTSRRELIDRLHSRVKTAMDMYHLMRYNNYEKDDESRHRSKTNPCIRHGMWSIAARGDLAIGVNCSKHIPYGAIDAKATDATMWRQLSPRAVIAATGPTSERQPPYTFPQRIVGIPLTFDFRPALFGVENAACRKVRFDGEGVAHCTDELLVSRVGFAGPWATNATSYAAALCVVAILVIVTISVARRRFGAVDGAGEATYVALS